MARGWSKTISLSSTYPLLFSGARRGNINQSETLCGPLRRSAAAAEPQPVNCQEKLRLRQFPSSAGAGQTSPHGERTGGDSVVHAGERTTCTNNKQRTKRNTIINEISDARLSDAQKSNINNNLQYETIEHMAHITKRCNV